MNIASTQQGNVTLVRLEGRFDAAASTEAEQRLLGLVAGGARRFVLDGSALEYISSAGLRVLLSVTKRIQASNGRLLLAALQPQVNEIIEIAGFTAILPVFRTCDEARAACAD